MASLSQLAEKSPLMDIDIRYNGKRYKFNLYKETQVNDQTLNREMKKHASSYAFLLQLRNSLEKKATEAEAHKDRVLNKLYLKYKKMTNPMTNRQFSDDAAKAKAQSSSSYTEAEQEYFDSLHHFKTLRDAIRAYEVRKELMQSLGANIRNER